VDSETQSEADIDTTDIEGASETMQESK